MRIIILLIVTAFQLACCAKKEISSVSENKPVSENKSMAEEVFTEIYASHNSNIKEYKILIITNQDELNSIYTLIDLEKKFTIDFQKETVVVLALGEKNTGGYDIGIDKIEETQNKIIVYTKEISPKDGAMVTMAFTNPVSVNKISSKKPIEIIR